MKTIYILLLLVVIVITVLVLQKMNDSIESFKVDINTVQPTVCPHNMSSYVDALTSDTLCCDGTVEHNICKGKTVCTLTPSGKSAYESCSQYLIDYNKEMESKHCFPEMPRYYEDDAQVPHISGCASQVNVSQSTPILNAKSCKIYSSSNDNMNKTDSCVNAKMELDLQNSSFCKMVNCKAAIVKFGASPPLISGTYGNPATGGVGTPNPVPLTCYSKESLTRYFKSVMSGEQLTNALNGINNGTNTYVCGYIPPCNKKAKYVQIKGTGYIQLSQIVIRDFNGKNIAKGLPAYGRDSYSPQSTPANAVDGNERTRAYPNIYHSKSADEDTFFYVQIYPPVCISQIIIYGRSDGYSERHANKFITIRDETFNNILWTSSKTTNDLVQTFNIPNSVFA
jgi:hypothetical protein